DGRRDRCGRRRLPRRERRAHPPAGLLRDGVRRQPRPRAPRRGGRQRRRVREHVERPVLRQRRAAGRRLRGRAARHEPRRPGRHGRALRPPHGGARRHRRHRHRAARPARVRRGGAADRALRARRRRARARGVARDGGGRLPDERRPPAAQLRDRLRHGLALREHGLGVERVSGEEPHGEVAGPHAVHRDGDARRRLALRRQPHGAALRRVGALRHRHPQRGGAHGGPHHPRRVRHAARPRPARRELARAVQARAGAGGAGRGDAARDRGRRLRLAHLLLRPRAAEARARPRVRRRRRPGGGRVREQGPARRHLPRPLGAERARVLHGDAVPGALPRRRVRRVPRLVEPRPGPAGGLQRGVRPAHERRRVRRARGVRRRLRRPQQAARRRPPPPRRPRRGPGRRAVRHRRQARPHLAHHLPGRSARGGV
ncbi:MAG: L-sorbosone dehydrogenase, partial [uncultured Gemmatimonadaceae bacterium]